MPPPLCVLKWYSLVGEFYNVMAAFGQFCHCIVGVANNDVTVENCTFTGGLMESTGDGAYASNLTIKDCTFKDTISMVP